MKCELFNFQKKAVNDLRAKVAASLASYDISNFPQVVSLQAPTGAGKTIIMTALIEDIFNGTETYMAQPDAIFVWLSDSPGLNEQSRQKIEATADKIRFGQCKMVNEASFDQEVFDDGYIYFLNTQKISKTANLCSKSDNRQYTIWETLQNTIEQKSDRFYVIIDEAHRGALGREAGRATSIMQKFIKGSAEDKLSPMPLVIGMSATPERFNMLIAGSDSTLSPVTVKADDVRSSGLLKDHILLLHPKDKDKYNELYILETATREWIDKCNRWNTYSLVQHEKKVYPAFVVQVRAATDRSRVSDTDLDEVIRRIEGVTEKRFEVGEVVHTFGSVSDIEINGLKVPHVEPADISDDKKIKVILFKENLSTGWDCPRAETMMSFSTAEDPTYIAQLLGRMIRTPLQRHIEVDDSLNEVRLFLPHFNAENCEKVVEALRSSEVDDYPVYIDESSVENHPGWASVHGGGKIKRRVPNNNDGQQDLFSDLDSEDKEAVKTTETNQPELESKSSNADDGNNIPENTSNNSVPQSEESCKPLDNGGYTEPLIKPTLDTQHIEEKPEQKVKTVEDNLFEFDREEVSEFINSSGFLSYEIRYSKNHSYTESLTMLATLLTDTGIVPEAVSEVSDDMTQMIHDYIIKLKKNNEYEKLKHEIIDMKMNVLMFDMFGKKVTSYAEQNMFYESDEILDPQLDVVDKKMGSFGIPKKYNIRYYDNECTCNYKIDSILFCLDGDCMDALEKYAKKKYEEMHDTNRIKLVRQPEKIVKRYNDIVSNADVVSKHSFKLPDCIGQEKGGKDYEYHLLVNAETGLFKAKLNTWEEAVLEEEFKRNDFVCWLRNPSRGSWALCIPYKNNGEVKGFYPDFLIIRKDETGYIMDILEPHNPNNADNLAKAQGLAEYSQNEIRIGRMEIIRKIDGKFVRLDMTKTLVREKVLSAITIEQYNRIFEELGCSY